MEPSQFRVSKTHRAFINGTSYHNYKKHYLLFDMSFKSKTCFKKKRKYVFSTFPSKVENNCNNHFIRKERLKTNFVYFSPHSERFTVTLSKNRDFLGTKTIVKKVFIDFKAAKIIFQAYFYIFYMYYFRNQLHTALENNYIKQRRYVCEIIIYILQGSKIIFLYLKNSSLFYYN